LADVHWYTAPEAGTQELWRAATGAIPVFEQQEASAPLAEAWWAVAEVHLFHCEFEQMRAAPERGLEAAQDAGREERARLSHAVGLAAMLGPTPVDEAGRLCAELRGEVEGHPVYAALLQLYEAYLWALDGRFD